MIGPSVHDVTFATPVASVVALPPTTDPPPVATAKDTATPATALASASITLTAGDAATAAPAIAVCVAALFAAAVVGAPGVSVTGALMEVSPVAENSSTRSPTMPE